MKSILCVDDDETGLALRKMMLEAEGYRVHAASTGEEGLAILQSQSIERGGARLLHAIDEWGRSGASYSRKLAAHTGRNALRLSG